MSDFVSLQVRRSVFEKLQRLAVLTGDESSAIEKLISHWERVPSALPRGSPGKPAAEVELWHSPTGDVLRVGELLQAADAGKTHQAVVERNGIKYNGVLYDSPSAAARAVKHARGLKGSSANTNGRDFWRLRDPKTNRWVPISSLRPAHRFDAEHLIAELDAQK